MRRKVLVGLMHPYSRVDDGASAAPSLRVALGVFCLSLLSFVALDACWIGLVAAGFYKQQLSSILKPDVDVAAAALSWAAIVGINQARGSRGGRWHSRAPARIAASAPAGACCSGSLVAMRAYAVLASA